MNTIRAFVLFSLSCVAGLFVFEQAVASERAAARLSLEQALEKIKKRYPGKVLGIRRIGGQGPQGAPVYKAKLVSKRGRVHFVFVDAQTGEVFKAD